MIAMSNPLRRTVFVLGWNFLLPFSNHAAALVGMISLSVSETLRKTQHAGVAMRKFAILAGLVGVMAYAMPAAGFETLGLKTGMTPAQVQVAAPQGYTLIAAFGADPQSYSFSATIVRGTDVFATVSFCHQRLSSVIREVDPNTEWAARLQVRLVSSGQPRVSMRSQPWTGIGGGDVMTVSLRWTSAGEIYDLSLNPEGRTPNGALRYMSSAFEQFAMEEPCRQ